MQPPKAGLETCLHRPHAGLCLGKGPVKLFVLVARLCNNWSMFDGLGCDAYPQLNSSRSLQP